MYIILYGIFNCSCLAGGYPSPTYEWFREEYDNTDQLLSFRIDPLSNNRFTLTGGTLKIDVPQQVYIYVYIYIDLMIINLNKSYFHVIVCILILFIILDC